MSAYKGDRKRLTVRIRAKLYKSIAAVAKARGISVNEAIEWILEQPFG